LESRKIEIQTPFELPTFKGWTIDARLKQFRKVSRGESPEIEFIDFNSEEGQALLDELREYFKFLWEE
jgi:hypothetical protein